MQAIIARSFFSSSDVTEKDPASWTVTKITGGNTNQLYCISGMNKSSNGKKNNKNSIPNSVLVRIFGAEGMIDRDVETSTYSSLAKQGLALKYYGRFGNGRMEEMLIGWKTLTEEDMMISQISDEIARQLAILHTTYVVPDHLIDYHDTRIEGGAQPTLWTQLYPWLERALQDQQQQQFKNEYDTDRVSKLQPSLATLKQEIDWLKLRIIDPNSSIGFCHNDLLASNIMMENTNTNGTTPTLQFIDYEYGGINYYSYDIANHFNEYAGGTAEEDNSTPNYERRPSKEQQIKFIESYVKKYNCSNETNTNATTVTMNDIFTEVNGFILANHLVWGLWGILQASSEGCEDGLDYIQYAKCRFDQYRSDKQKYLSTFTKLN
ncbi:kinase-like protein [Fragilariopsis cylindrus CCMP1102]|uniref:ethanolamine kinase n=1 Tax=Fragilariopsis cylindrus CCMP1102 TaxID=635003 RepID=A0A1E7FS97_9STRA|nr:kinase-like protein [Fragilariopsis cylindrus CCMP1102]|eukprot:OEU21041.1 kinase-like protein [Fragilariopsis cylindrus CCMP1102]